MWQKITTFKIPRKFTYWWLIGTMFLCLVYCFWASSKGKADAMMGITGGLTTMVLIKNIDNKGKWDGIDKMIFIVFGFTTALAPFIP